MNSHKYIITFLIWTIFISLESCINHSENNSKFDKIKSNGSSAESQQTNKTTTDSLNLYKNEMTKIYTQAISEFIKAANKKNKTIFDTLYFGKHIYGQPDDFPDIELPETIENTHIRLVTPEIGLKKQAENKSLYYVNMIGWVDKKKAEFVLVVFTNGGEHQYDYYINFNYHTASNKFELDKIEFKNYIHLSGKKPQRTTSYKDSKYN